MTNKRDLKAFVRYDGSGRVVAGSLILRRQMPKVGKWKEIQGYQCCNQNQTPVLVEILDTFPMVNASLRVEPDNGDFFQRILSYTGETAADIDALAALFNASFKNLGTFTVVSGDLYYTPSTQIAQFYTANHTTALIAAAFAD